MPAFRIAAPARTLWIIALLLGFEGRMPACVAEEATSFSDEDIQFFESKIRPVLVEHCYACHSAQSKSIKAGLQVDSRTGLLQGGDSGPALVPGDLDESLLIAAVRYESYEMPPSGKLPEPIIKDIESWILRSAPWPLETAPSGDAEEDAFDLEQRRASHWAWQPLASPTPPVLHGENESEPRGDIDRYVLASLRDAGIEPAGPVGRGALLRRLSFDLVGLPPTPAELEAYINDPSPDATRRVVDRLLESPRFGERWGRHWLDLVRYAESRGHEFDQDAAGAHHYRDYVIRALNADVPYHQFVKEHIAGDLLEEPRLNPEQGFNESILGTGFWFLGEWAHSPVDIRKDETDRFDNMIDCFSKTFLALTVSCARCHDHKFDAISTEDYYALSGVLQSSQFAETPFESVETNRRVAGELRRLNADFQARLSDALATAETLADSAAAKSAGLLHPAAQAIPPPPLPDDGTWRLVFDYTRPAKPAASPEAADPQLTRNDFHPDGFAYGDRPIRAGEWIVQKGAGGVQVARAAYGAARNDPFWDALEVEREPTINDRTPLTTINSNSRGLRTPTFELSGGHVSLQVRGSGHAFACVDSHRLVAGPLHGNTLSQIAMDPGDRVRWVHLDLTRYVGHRLHLELTPAEDASLELLRVVDSASARTDLFKAQEVRKASWNADDYLAGLPPEAARQIAELQREWLARRDELAKRLHRKSRLAMTMMDGDGEDDRLLIRGNASAPGPLVRRRFLAAIDPSPLGGPHASGRRQLADRVTDPANPLYSRVIVNRVWHHLLGRGIVASVDDFGFLGQRPTHPELLDHLAQWFLSHGQSIKQLIRYIVLSDTYQMSGNPVTQSAQQRDPSNQLWHHRVPKRLEAEVIRDTLLAVSGNLDATMYGASVPVHLTSFMDGRGRPASSGPLDGDRRRSIYLGVRRNFLSPFMLAFDLPVPFSTMGRRNVSNVPAQSLILMNDPLVEQCAQRWAQRLLVEEPEQDRARIARLYNSAFARDPSSQEQQLVLEYLQQRAADADRNEHQLWAELTHAVINSKEFIFVP